MNEKFSLPLALSLCGVVAVLLALCVVAPALMPFNHMDFSLLLVREMLLATSLYFLGRCYGLGAEEAALAGFVSALSGYILYFQVGVGGCQVSLAWVFFAWGTLRRVATAQEPPIGGIIAAFFIFLALLCGRAIEYAALATILAVLCGEDIARGGRRTGWILAAAAMGVAFYWPVAGPLAAGWQGGIAADGRLTPTLGQVLNLSNPLWMPHVSTSEANFLLPAPVFFAVWFVWPLLFFIDWPRAKEKRQAGISALCGVFLFLSVGAERMGPLFWPIDWLPYVQASLFLGLFLVVTPENSVMTSARRFWAMAVLVATSYVSVMENPGPAARGLFLPVLCAIFIAALPKIKGTGMRYLFLGATSALLPVIFIPLFPDLYTHPAALPAPQALFLPRHSWSAADFVAPAAAILAWLSFSVRYARRKS